MGSRYARSALALALALVLIAGGVIVVRAHQATSRTRVTAYFANSNGLFPGDEVRILGVAVGTVDAITPEPTRTKINFSIGHQYKVPAEASAVMLSPSLVTSRAIQLTPAYTGGALLRNGAVIPQERTAVPVEYDDLREQLAKLTDALQPTRPGGVSTLGAFINTSADNLRGEGFNIRQSLIQISQTFSALGDHSNDLFGTIKNLSVLVSALQNSTDLMRHLNQNLAAVTGLLADDPNEVGTAVHDINAVVGDVRRFAADNQETIGTTSDKLASVTTALNQSLDDIKQTLHIGPNGLQNFLNIYQPAQGALTGALVVNNFANPISFICGAIQAASRLNADQSAKLCVQYLAPIIKNRQYNFPPIGENLFVGASARPNEVTYSEDWMRPDYIPPQPSSAPPADLPPPVQNTSEALPVPSPDAVATDPAGGLPGMMLPAGGQR